MHAFTDLVTGTIRIDQVAGRLSGVKSTTRLSSTVLAMAPELAFLQSTQGQNEDQAQSLQQGAAGWVEQPFAGLVNAGAAPKLTLPFQEALEQVFQNITLSLMSAPDLQPNSSSIYYPNKTLVTFSTRENIYIYSVSKLWLAYGLAVGTTALIAASGLGAILANHASFSNKFSTVLRLSRGAHISCEINQKDLSGRDPLPDYAKKATVKFLRDETSAKDGKVYNLVDIAGVDDDRKVSS